MQSVIETVALFLALAILSQFVSAKPEPQGLAQGFGELAGTALGSFARETFGGGRGNGFGGLGQGLGGQGFGGQGLGGQGFGGQGFGGQGYNGYPGEYGGYNNGYNGGFGGRPLSGLGSFGGGRGFRRRRPFGFLNRNSEEIGAADNVDEEYDDATEETDKKVQENGPKAIDASSQKP